MITASAVMARFVEYLPADASVRDAATLMGELDFGALPIGDSRDLLGIVTDRDILYRATAEGLSPDTPIERIMTRTVIGCVDTDPLTSVLDAMGAHHIRRMPVRHGKEPAVIGWITLSDVSRHLLLQDDAIRTALENLGTR